MRRWSWRCCYCPALASHLDHVVPIAKGGADVEHNIVPACAACNLSKGAKTLAEWAESWTRDAP
jgi:5-methylcytosine-specific restriction endonuclease McrA